MGIYNKLMGDGMAVIRVGLIALPFVAFGLFCLLVSSSLSNRVAFFALCMSVLFIGISLYFLCWIIERDSGSSKMKEISEPIREGSEGFFIT